MYQETNDKGVIRLADKAFIPLAKGNSDYAIYQSWLAEGNTPKPMEQTKPPPDRVSKLCVLERLQAVGKFDAAHDALTADPFMYQRWLASRSVDPDDKDVCKLLKTIGADPGKILAPDRCESELEES